MDGKEFLDLGNHFCTVSTENGDAQRYFDLGLNQMYGFNHEDSIRWFHKALECDSHLAIAHWGISHSYAWNYNNPEGLDEKKALLHIQIALELLEYANKMEEMLIKAAQCRFKGNHEKGDIKREFIKEMRIVYEEYPSHPDIIAFFVETLMNVKPWELWIPMDNGKIMEETLEAKRILELSLKKFPSHPGLLHEYIHLMELSNSPKDALKAAETLGDLCTEQGHLIHMPSHIYMWMGDYKRAIESNEKAIIADNKYVKISGYEYEFYKMYRLHNVHFCSWAAMFDGQYSKSLANARAMQDELSFDELNSEPGIDILEGFNCIVWHVFIRFGKWKEILEEPVPDDKDTYTMTRTTAFYSKGLAYASLGMVKEAEEQKELFLESLNNPKMYKRLMINNYAYRENPNQGIFFVAKSMLFGEIEYRKANYEIAFNHLREAVNLYDNLVYDEPWGWMVPPRHALAALLLEQNYLEESISVYRKDLETNVDNLWCLKGLLDCLQTSSFDNTDEIKIIEDKLKLVTVRADIDPNASCYCAISAGAKPPSCCNK